MNESFWFVGASYDRTNDQTQRFLADGIWENGHDDVYLDQLKACALVNALQSGPPKPQKHNLPLDANGQPISVMVIKAIGTITESMRDGKGVQVE